MLQSPVERDVGRPSGAADEFFRGTFVAPCAGEGGVDLKNGDARWTLSVRPAGFHGWGLFAPVSRSAARVVRRATAEERRQFLSRLPVVRLVICGEATELGAPAVAFTPADARFNLAGRTVAMLAFNVDLFETVLARFDGRRYWFDQADAQTTGDTAARLRSLLARRVAATSLPRRLAPGQRTAYAAAVKSMGRSHG